MMTCISQFPKLKIEPGVYYGTKYNIPKVKVGGSGNSGNRENPAELVVDCSESGIVPLKATVETPYGDA